MNKQEEYSVAKEIIIVSFAGIPLGVFILVIGISIVELLKG
ncbi:MAG: hypothetical protein V3S05_03270 [Desulfobacterales bacterium]